MSDDCLRLLIVDPEPLIAIDIERIVSETTPCMATILTELGQARPGNWDLVICDCPDFTPAFQARIAAAFPETVALILVSASDTVVRAASPWIHVGKPFTNSSLITAVRQVLDARPSQDRPAGGTPPP